MQVDSRAQIATGDRVPGDRVHHDWGQSSSGVAFDRCRSLLQQASHYWGQSSLGATDSLLGTEFSRRLLGTEYKALLLGTKASGDRARGDSRMLLGTVQCNWSPKRLIASTGDCFYASLCYLHLFCGSKCLLRALRRLSWTFSNEARKPQARHSVDACGPVTNVL